MANKKETAVRPRNRMERLLITQARIVEKLRERRDKIGREAVEVAHELLLAEELLVTYAQGGVPPAPQAAAPIAADVRVVGVEEIQPALI